MKKRDLMQGNPPHRIIRHRTAIGFSIIAAIVTVFAACTSQKGTSNEPAQKPADAKLSGTAAVVPETDPLLKGWKSETFALPPDFAPEFPTGTEALRFSPGWRDPKAADFWSYAFVMWIDEAAPDEARMKELLEKYYNGLLSSFAAAKNKDISKTPARVEVVRTATNYFELKLHVIDAFATFDPIDLRLAIGCYPQSDESSVLHILVNPQPGNHAIWRSLEAAIGSIVSREGALQKKVSAVDPMSSFSRMIGGEWKMTAQSGTSMFDTWHWGPGEHSVRVMTDGLGADGKPWREVQVYYWHPGRRQVCMLGLSPYASGVSEGSIKFDGEAADTNFDLNQAGNTPRQPIHRQMGRRWDFDGQDKYHEKLLEANGATGFALLAEWDRTRSMVPRTKSVRSAGDTPKLSDRMKVFEPLLGRTWGSRGEAKGSWDSGESFHIETTFEWVPLANAVYARTFALRGNGQPIHLIDAYFYHHTGTGQLRCLALASPEGGRGRVYEGDVKVLEGGGGGGGGAIQLDLKGYEGKRVVPYVVQLDFEKESLHQRAWSVDSATNQRTLMLDVHHTASEMSKNIMVVFQDKKNNYWFGSDIEGVYRYDEKTISHFTTKDGLVNDRVRGIQEDKSGNMYFATADGISKFDGKTFSTLIPVISTEWKLDPDDLWFPGSQNTGVVNRYDGKVLHGLQFPNTKLGDEHYAQFPRSKYPNMRSSPYDVYSIFKDSKGHIWFGTGTGVGMLGACRFDGKSFTWISSDELEFGGSAYCVRSIAEDKDGKFWFSNTKHRFEVFQNDATTQGNAAAFRKENGVSHSQDSFPYFMSSTKDNNGDLWMASFGAGVWRFDGKDITQYPVLDDGRPVTLFSIYKDNQGVLWLGSHEAGPYKFSGTTFEKFKP